MSKEQTIYIHNYSSVWKSIEINDFVECRFINNLIKRKIRFLKKSYPKFSIIQKGTILRIYTNKLYKPNKRIKY